jgi:hypothetical protein
MPSSRSSLAEIPFGTFAGELQQFRDRLDVPVGVLRLGVPQIGAEYHDSVKINRGSGARLPALVVGTALAALLLLGFVYPKVWSNWVLHHTVTFDRAIEQTV